MKEFISTLRIAEDFSERMGRLVSLEQEMDEKACFMIRSYMRDKERVEFSTESVFYDILEGGWICAINKTFNESGRSEFTFEGSDGKIYTWDDIKCKRDDKALWFIADIISIALTTRPELIKDVIWSDCVENV